MLGLFDEVPMRGRYRSAGFARLAETGTVRLYQHGTIVIQRVRLGIVAWNVDRFYFGSCLDGLVLPMLQVPVGSFVEIVVLDDALDRFPRQHVFPDREEVLAMLLNSCFKQVRLESRPAFHFVPTDRQS